VVVIEEIVVGGGIEKVLIRYRIGSFGYVVREIRIGLKISIVIFDLEFRAFTVSARPIELREDDGLAKLAVVKHVGRIL
jgi:hypothetical protein